MYQAALNEMINNSCLSEMLKCGNSNEQHNLCYKDITFRSHTLHNEHSAERKPAPAIDTKYLNHLSIGVAECFKRVRVVSVALQFV
jgi:predicted ATPase